MSVRARDLDVFYDQMTVLATRVGGPRLLSNTTGRQAWPERGVYFFFEPGEYRADGSTPRCVRVGTHGLRSESKSTLWGRLRAHRGNVTGGNHRGSVFRLHVGEALINRGDVGTGAAPRWAKGSSAPRTVRDVEAPVEARVSAYIGAMSVLWIDVPDEPGPDSERGSIERNMIALLSNHGKDPIDPPSARWLGRHARAAEIRSSGLWNVNHMSEDYHAGALDLLSEGVERTPY